MIVKKSELAALYVALGLDTAASWPAAKLNAKTNTDQGIARYREPGQAITDPALEALFDQIAADQTAGNLIEVEDDGDVTPPKPAPKPAAVKAKPAAKAPAEKKPRSPTVRTKYAGFPDWQSYYADLQKNPKTLKDKKGGVLVETVKLLKQAGKEGKGVTKEHILGVLKETVPGRSVEKMAVTLNNNVPARLRWMYGIHVWTGTDPSGSRTYWIKGDGRTPQHVGAKAKKTPGLVKVSDKKKTAPKKKNAKGVK